MDTRELEGLLNDLESDRVERKEALTDPERVRQAICAFANDLPNHRLPGVLFIGARDNGDAAGLTVSDDLLTKLAGFSRDVNILPFPSMTVEKVILKGAEMAVVTVLPVDAPPVRVRGVTWIRVGPRRGIATPEEERRLGERRRGRDLPFDLQPLPSGGLGDLNLEAFEREYLPLAVAPEIIEQNGRTQEQKLVSLRFLTTDQVPQPTVLGVLTLGRNPRDFVPGDYIQFLRIAGKTLSDPIKDQKELDGPLERLLRQLDEVLALNISTGLSVEGGTPDTKHPDYPIEALRQLARNAVLHRSYEGTNSPVRITWFDDRVEILSPGGPFGLVNRANFGRPGICDYRNPHLAEVLKNLGYVQRFGMGIALARTELERNGNPPLDIVVEETHVLETLWRRP